MSDERFDAIDRALQKLTILHEATDDRIRVLADGVAANTERLDRVEERLDRVEGRLNRVEGRLDRIEGRLDRVEGRLDRVEAGLGHVQRGLGEVNAKVDSFMTTQLQINRELADSRADHERRLSALEANNQG